MSITIHCAKCNWITDIELISDTNPTHCPKCGSDVLIDGTGEPLYDDSGEYNKILFQD